MAHGRMTPHQQADLLREQKRITMGLLSNRVIAPDAFDESEYGTSICTCLQQ